MNQVQNQAQAHISSAYWVTYAVVFSGQQFRPTAKPVLIGVLTDKLAY